MHCYVTAGWHEQPADGPPAGDTEDSRLPRGSLELLGADTVAIIRIQPVFTAQSLRAMARIDVICGLLWQPGCELP